MTRKVTSFQMTDADQRKFDALEAAGHGTRTDIIRTAIDRMYREEISTMTTQQVHLLTVSNEYRDGTFHKFDDIIFLDRQKAIAYAQKLTGDTRSTDWHFVSDWRDNAFNSIIADADPGQNELRVIVAISAVDTFDNRV